MRRKIVMRRGFTLIELLVVLVILALLAGIVLPKFLQKTDDAKVAAARSQISQFKTALQLYAVDNGQYPSTQQGLQALITEPTTSPKPTNWKKELDIPAIPQDPWGNNYDYSSPGPNGEDFYIVSYGKDGRPQGSGYDADITSADVQGQQNK